MLYIGASIARKHSQCLCLCEQVKAPMAVQVTVDGEALVDDGVAAVLYSVFLVKPSPLAMAGWKTVHDH